MYRTHVCVTHVDCVSDYVYELREIPRGEQRSVTYNAEMRVQRRNKLHLSNTNERVILAACIQL